MFLLDLTLSDCVLCKSGCKFNSGSINRLADTDIMLAGIEGRRKFSV